MKKGNEKVKVKGKESDKVNIIPLGGLGAVGKNITLFSQNDEIIIVDCGIMFPRDEMPGIDYIIPDFTYIRQNKSKVKGIVITHGHEDHIGAISFLLKEVRVPIYATRLTIGLIQSRLEENSPAFEPVFIEVKPRQVEQVGSFTIEFIGVNHSIIGGVGLAIQTCVGTIIHTGDFKIDFSPVEGEVTDLFRFAHYGEKGVLLLLSDSTNAEREGFTKSESTLLDKLSEIFSTSKSRIIVASFASNLQRIQQVLDTAKKFNRKVVISGFSMQKNIEIANTLGFLDIKDDLIIKIEDASKYPNKKIVVIGTGSQGEPMSALARMAFGTHRHFIVEKGDTVIITASVIPGNERTVTTIINSLMETGANVYYDKDENIHVSGHGSSKELKLMLAVTKPTFFMPIHGEFKQLKKHADIAEILNIKAGHILIAKNGDILELTKKSFKKTGKIPLLEMYVDGSEIGDVASDVIKERHLMSTDGIFYATAVISQGMPLTRPDITTKGFISAENKKIHNLLQKEMEDKLHRMLKERKSGAEIEEFLKKSLKNYIYKLTRRNPLIVVQIIEV